MASPNDDTKETAMSHTPPPGAEADGGDLDLSLMKKKKKKVKKDDDDAAEEAPAPADGEEAIDLTMKKKKKKKVVKEEDEFAKKLEALKLEGKEGEEGAAGGAAAAPAELSEQDGDMEKGTGIWQHDEVKTITYEPLLSRFFALLAQKNPDHATSGTRSYKIPPPQCLREGNKKTIFANIAEICKRMKRTDEHVTSYLFAELGTTGSVDGSRRLVIKGKFQQKQIENVLRTYIIEYVTCKTCRSPNTELSKGENRLYFITCNSCGSRRSVQAIKTGFSAQVGKRRKMQG
ncbi:eukaryotic translation initiation factor 2 beta subunit [Echria macrotheca]|uniref:Eukaryotic translation initiation factor 2 beta subunit n=1 Tax=Echria macrotheca TaxID=438768 RepID=A0AAJ0B2S6_9PEZI|nr:eukaryotic translation initiation factor 2 beta subunit [Echria macrotheca]